MFCSILLLLCVNYLVPGIMGTQLEATLHDKSSDHWYCFKTYNKWYRLWLDLDDVFVVTQDCFRENIRQAISMSHILLWFV